MLPRTIIIRNDASFLELTSDGCNSWNICNCKWWPKGIRYRNPTGTPKMSLMECNEIISSFISNNLNSLPESLVLKSSEASTIKLL